MMKILHMEEKDVDLFNETFKSVVKIHKTYPLLKKGPLWFFAPKIPIHTQAGAALLAIWYSMSMGGKVSSNAWDKENMEKYAKEIDCILLVVKASDGSASVWSIFGTLENLKKFQTTFGKFQKALKEKNPKKEKEK